MSICLRLMGAALMIVALHGCGDHDGPAAIDDSFVFPAGQATLTFSAISTARLAAPIGAIDLSITLPQGMSVATTSGASGQIDTASVLPGSALVGTNLAFGTYSASSRKARLSMATASDTYRSGQFLRLICTVAPDTAITLHSLKALNLPVGIVKAAGYDQAASSTVVLTDRIKVNMDVLR